MKQSTVNFKVLNYEYINTGGNTMVGVFTIWLPDELRTIYALTNEEGCNLSVVDYISNDLEIHDYDELIFDNCVFNFLNDTDKYFELYRYCLNEYTKSDCRYFGITRCIPYKLLSDELQASIDANYLAWLEYHNYDVLTDGESIVTHPDFEWDDDLKYVIGWQKWHDDLVSKAGMEEVAELYNKKYRISFNGKRVYIPFNADTYSLIDDLMKAVIKEW